MRDLIRKILREETDGVKTIKENYEKVEKNLPKILKLIKVMLKGHYDEIKVGKKNIFYGSDNYLSESFLINIYNNDGYFPVSIKDLFNGIRDFVGIDPSLYGVPLDIQFVNTKTLKESKLEITKIRRRTNELEEELLYIMRNKAVRNKVCIHSKENWIKNTFNEFFEDFEDYVKAASLNSDEEKQIREFIYFNFQELVEKFWTLRCDKNSNQQNEQV